MVIIYNKNDYLTKVIEAEQWCRIKYWQHNKQAFWRAIIFRQTFIFFENLETFSENFNFLLKNFY
jgi:uncharacterized protein YhfF